MSIIETNHNFSRINVINKNCTHCTNFVDLTSKQEVDQHVMARDRQAQHLSLHTKLYKSIEFELPSFKTRM